MSPEHEITFESVRELIKSRRTVRQFTDQPVDDRTIFDLIDTAVWAPNHRMTEPWRFYVLRKSGEARGRVAQLAYDWTMANVKNPNPERARSSADAARQELLDAPALVYVYSVPGPSDEVTQENYSATSCAVQNLMLAARAKGLGVGWSTGKSCRSERLAEAIGADPGAKVVGCLYIGYPAAAPTSKRVGADEVTSWL